MDTINTVTTIDSKALRSLGIQDIERHVMAGVVSANDAMTEVVRRIDNRHRAGKKQIPQVAEFHNRLAAKLGALPIDVPVYSAMDRAATAFPDNEAEAAEHIIACKLDPAKVITELTKLVAGQ